MPGHIKLVKGAADLDSTEFLLPSIKLKHAVQAEPYNTKKGSWIPDPNTRGYREGCLESGTIEDPASNCVFAVAHEKLTHKGSGVGKVDPHKFGTCKDKVNLTLLNDASVCWNLGTPYQAKMLHTHAGLFMVFVNPRKHYPLYIHRECRIYLGKRIKECPPHLWAINEVPTPTCCRTRKTPLS